jgi:hypothetical protein
MHYGRWPADQIDHINRIRTDNRIANLREATNNENVINQPARSNVDVRGVHWRERDSVFYAQITHRGKKIFLGHYGNLADAANAYRQKARELFGEFAA